MKALGVLPETDRLLDPGRSHPVAVWIVSENPCRERSSVSAASGRFSDRVDVGAMSSNRLGYARISTADQDPALQHDALAAAGCFRVFTDIASGKLDRRPQLDALLEQLRPGDALVVWRLDRLGRSMEHLIATVKDLEDRKVALVSLHESIDTSTATGRLVFHVFGALAQFERELLRERTMAGLEAARARGRRGGRPRVMTPEKASAARLMIDSGGYSMATIAATVGVSRSTLYAHLAEERRYPPGGH